MTTSESKTHRRSERLGSRLPRLAAHQLAIEHEAIRFRAGLGLSDYVELPLEVAARAIPGCEILGLKHVPGITLQHLVYARTNGYRAFGALSRRDGDCIQIVYNDAHQAPTIRVNVMEEIFHVMLGHRPDIVSTVPREGRYRTHDGRNEAEAVGCAMAALLPFAGLQSKLSRFTHIARIAEDFCVPVEVVQKRIEATRLGHLMNAQIRQYALVPFEETPAEGPSLNVLTG